MTSTQPPSLGSVSVRATRRGQFADRAYDDKGQMVHLSHRIVDPGEVFSCPVEDLALEEDHGAIGWMQLVSPDELLSLLPPDEAALWGHRRAAAANLASAAATLEVSRREHAAHKMIATTSTDRQQAAVAQGSLHALAQTIAQAEAAQTEAQAHIASAEAIMTRAQAEHAAARESLARVRAAKNPPPSLVTLREQTMETPNEQWRPKR